MRGSRLFTLAAIAILGLLLSPGLYAQSTGDFRSFQNGNWNAVNSWERFDGVSWINPAPNTPTSSEGIVTILSGDTIVVTMRDSVDQLVVDGVLRVRDTLIILDGTGSDAVVNGTVRMDSTAGRLSLSSIGTPAISFASGSVYNHTVNGGSIPTATWGTGSTCLITGPTANAPANGNQSFYNVTWNCPGQTPNLNMGWNGITIGGTITVLNTGSGRWQMCAPTAGSSATVTINGDVIQSTGNFTTNGTSNGTTTIVINHNGNVNVTGGNFSISRGSQGGTGTSTWYLNSGNFSMSNATTQNSNATGAKFVFTKAGTQALTLGSGNTLTALPIEVDSGTTLDVGISAVQGSGIFLVNATAGLQTSHPSGFYGNLQISGTRTLSTAANYIYAGTAAQAGDSLLPATVRRLVINNAAGVTLNDTLTVSDTLAFVNGKLSLGTSLLTASAISGASPTAYVATTGTGGLAFNSVGSTATMFPVGTSFSYAPVWITNHGTADAFTVSVATDVTPAPAGGRVMLNWNIAEGVAGGSTSKIKFGWMASQENTAMIADRPNSINFFRMTDTTEVGKGYYSTQFATEPHTAERDSIASFGPFALGRFKGTATSVGDITSLTPEVFQLQQNYPNPFNPSTTIKYDIPKSAHVSLRVYDALGRMVAELVNSDHQPGFHSVDWNAGEFTSGVYYYRIVAGEFVSVKKLMLVK